MVIPTGFYKIFGTHGHVAPFLDGNNTWTGFQTFAGGSSGLGLTTVGLSLPVSVFSVSNSPLTSNGTIVGSFVPQAPNLVWAGPISGASAVPTFRSVVSADVPPINLASNVNGGVTGILGVANGGSKWSWSTNSGLLLDVFAPSVGDSASYTQQVSLNGAASTFGGFFNFGGVNIRGYQGVITYTKSSQKSDIVPGYNASTCAAYLVGENDNAASPVTYNIAAFGAYIEVRAGNDQWSAAIEADAQNTSGNDARTVDPFNMFGISADTGVGKPVNYALWCYPGGTKVPYGANNASAAIGIQGDGITALQKRGIVVGNDAISAVNGHKVALYMPVSNDIAWLASSGGSVGYLSTADAVKLTWSGGPIYSNSSIVMGGSNTTLSNGAASQTATMTNAPISGNPTKWLPYDDHGTTRYIPSW